MSGRKTTYATISTDELNNLRNQAYQATSLSRTNTNLKQRNEILERWNNTNQNAIREQENRIKTLNDNIARMNNRIAEQKAAATKETQELRMQLQKNLEDSNRRIQEEARKNKEKIQEMQQNFSTELMQTKSDLLNTIKLNNENINREIKNLESHIEEQMVSINSELDAVESRLGNIEASIDKTKKDNNIMLEMAQEYKRIAKITLEEIETKHRIDLLPKERQNNCHQATDSCENEIREAQTMPGNSATARHDAKKAYLEVQRLYQDVLKAEQEWELHLGLTRQVIGATRTKLEASKIIKLSEEDSVDINHWTDGDLGNLQDRLESLEKQLNTTEILQKLYLEDLDGIKDAGIQITHEVEETTFFGLAAFYASQDRADIAQDIADQLGELGLTIEGHSYQGNDQRAAHRLHLKNHTTGFEIVITQTPETKEDGTITNKIESDIIKYGYTNRDSESCHKLASEILSSVSGLGFVKEESKTEPGFENKESDRTDYRNINQWKTVSVTEVAKPKHKTSTNSLN